MSPVAPAINALADAWGEGMLRACWQGGAAITLVWLTARAVPRLPPAAQCWLWRLAYLKLVLALFWATPVDVRIPLPAESAERTGTPRSGRSFGFLAGGLRQDPGRPSRQGTSGPFGRHPAAGLQPRIAGPAPRWDANSIGAPTRPRLTWLSPLMAAMALWLLGSIGCWRRILRACRAARQLRGQCVPLRDAAALDCCAAVAAALGLRRPPGLFEGLEIRSPLLLGGREPAVLLPASLVRQAAPSALRLALAHELAHLKRGDLRWGWLRAAVHGFFFFHPLLWLAAREWRLAQEMACDAEALRVSGARAGEYGELLLAVVSPPGHRWDAGLDAPGSLGIGEESAGTLRRRLMMLRSSHSRRPLDRDPAAGRRRPVALAALIAAAAVALIPWRVTAQEGSAPPPSPRPEVATPAVEAPLVAVAVGEAPAEPADPPRTSAPPGAGAVEPAATSPAEREPALAEQWEDVLLLEAVRYLRLSTAQLRQLLTLARSGGQAFDKLADREKRTRAAVARIARENRAALLAGRPGVRQDDALELERSLRRRRALLEEQLVEFALPRLARILTREQVVRVCLLTLGSLPRERDRTLSAALLDPEAGFVFAPGADPPPGRALVTELRERVGRLQGRWEEHRDTRARQLLAAHYPPEVLDRVFTPRFWLASLPVVGELFQAVGGSRIDYAVIGAPGGGDEEDPLVAAARRDLETLRARSQVSLQEVLLADAGADDLVAGLRPFTRRVFLSPRLHPVLEERLAPRAP
jgi:beta-lactamase regulating signal transducer with metallopeptidase domain